MGSAPVYTATLGRDAGGRTQQQAEVLDGVTTTDVYGYDSAGRLETVARNGTLAVTHGYDANGIRNAVTTAGGTIVATFDAQDRILTSGTRTYTHTSHGKVAGWTVGLIRSRGHLPKAVRVPRNLAQRLAREASRQRRPRAVVARDILAAGLGVAKDDPGAEARRQSLLVRARESELEAIRFVIDVADVTGWQ